MPLTTVLIITLSYLIWTIDGSELNNLRFSPHSSIVARSVIHHADGINRTCANENTIKNWILKKTNKHLPTCTSFSSYSVLLAVNEAQLPLLINWLAIAVSLGYLPSKRVKLYFQCEDELTRLFIINALGYKCMQRPKRRVGRETPWRRMIKNRLASLLELALNMDNPITHSNISSRELGVTTFDLDAPWIRNIVLFFDHLIGTNCNENDGYDYISQGTIMNDKFEGKVISNFGVVLFRNSDAAKSLARKAKELLNSQWEASWPDQEYVTSALFEAGNASQFIIRDLSNLTEDKAFYKVFSSTESNLCKKYPSTCKLTVSGTEGTYSLPSVNSFNGALDNGTALITGRYLFLPQVVAPRDCNLICSSSSVYVQHCGIAYCLRKDPNLDVPCMCNIAVLIKH
jgi:hypothetical protein